MDSKDIRRIWIIALIVGVVSAVPVMLLKDIHPWVIAVPMLLGAIVVAADYLRRH